MFQFCDSVMSHFKVLARRSTILFFYFRVRVKINAGSRISVFVLIRLSSIVVFGSSRVARVENWDIFMRSPMIKLVLIF